jgi:dihydropteroate synthase
MSFAKRDRRVWALKSRSIELGTHTVVMGVLNVTPDSFSDGGDFLETSRAVEHALEMLEEGAAIVDIGGESTHPGAYPELSAEAESERILPVIAGILAEHASAILSVDTYHAETARAAIEAGAEIVNDVSGFLWDEAMAETCAALRCGVVLMHTRGRPHDWRKQPKLNHDEVVPLVKRDLRQRLNDGRAAGVKAERIVLDPGFGFGKSFEANYPLLAHLEELQELGQPLLAGVSRKSFLGRTLASLHDGSDAPPELRGNATLSATTASILAGADIVRVHNVRPALEAARIADAILSAL